MVRKPLVNSSLTLLLALGCIPFLTGCGDTTAPAVGQADPAALDDESGVVTLGMPVPEQQPERVPNPFANDSEGIVRVSGQSNSGSIQTAAASEAVSSSGTAKELLDQIAQLRAAPIDVVKQPNPQAPGEFVEVQLAPEQITAERNRRLYEILDLAVQAVGKSFRDANHQEEFNAAIVYLADTRMQLALIGDDQQGNLLQEDAETLFKQDPTSFAAVEAAFKLLQLTQFVAQQQSNDPRWSIAFARQSRMFAERFPQETSRVTVGLASAGRQADQLGQTEEARLCYQTLRQRYPESPFAQQCEAVLRRLSLVGQPLVDFGGQAMDGGSVSVEHYLGKPMVIVFWSTESPQFRQDLPLLKQSLAKLGDNRVGVVGVNLDTDEQAVDQFLATNNFARQHIFYADPGFRGPQNLVANYYGVSQVPTYWVVDREGKVVSIHASAEQLVPLLEGK